MTDTKSFQFEESLAQLEQLVEKMEQGELSLEDSLAAFEQGIRLTRECQQALREAEQKVRLLMAGDDDDAGRLVDFDSTNPTDVER